MTPTTANPIQEARPSRYAWSVLAVLSFVYLLNFLDRQLVSILAKPIQDELHLTDGELGRVGGIYFALFYAGISVPVAWAADRGNRVRILSLACLVWSAATIACGLAATYPQLVAARLAVGVGEAGGAPPSYSIIADYFPPARRGTALALFSLATPLGQALGVALGAGIAAAYGWRSAFLAVGATGVAAAAAARLWVREPARGGRDGVARPDTAIKRATIGAAIRSFARRQALWTAALAAGTSSFCGYAILSFATLYLMRILGMSLAEVAVWYALVVGCSTAAGIVASGRLVDRLARADIRAYALVPGAAIVGCIPFFAGFLLATDWRTALACLAVPLFLSVFYLVPAATLVQNNVAPEERTMSSALLLLILNVLGLGLGPTYLGAMSDHFRASGTARPLASAYWSLLPFFLLAGGLHLLSAWLIGRSAREPSR